MVKGIIKGHHFIYMFCWQNLHFYINSCIRVDQIRKLYLDDKPMFAFAFIDWCNSFLDVTYLILLFVILNVFTSFRDVYGNLKKKLWFDVTQLTATS